MYDKRPLGNRAKLQLMSAIKALAHKESFIGLYFLLFIMGITVGSGYGIYNESRIVEVNLLLGLGLYTCFYKRYIVTRVDWLFFTFIVVGSFFWSNTLYVIVDLLLFYLLYKSFYFLDYRPLLTKLLVLSSFLIFLLLPVALWDYLNSGSYSSYWYLSRLNIRIYNSYLLIISIFAVWFYLTEQSFKNLYLFFLFLAFLSILLDAGRSATLAYTVFIFIICVFNRLVRWKLISLYVMSLLTYLAITYLAGMQDSTSSIIELQIARATTSQRYDIWMNAVQCWVQSPIWGCGFYQLDSTQTLAAHPHNLFLQVLSETGLIGLGLLLAIVFFIAKNMSWNLRQNYFVIAALLAIGVELSLSGIHIYPITQIGLLWLFVFLLKNPNFSHAKNFTLATTTRVKLDELLFMVIYISIFCFFLYTFITTTALANNELMTRPRFLENGYRLY